MKKKNFILRKFSQVFTTCLMIPALSFMAASCSDDDDKPDPNEISDLTGTVTLAANEAENTTTLTFTARSAWEASPSNEESKWFSFTPASGAAGNATITISAPYNDAAAKTGKLTIKHGTKNYEVTVNQSAGTPDVAIWDAENKTGLLQTSFAQDSYNATEEMPISYTIKLTSKKDYSTLEEAPFKILAFEADNQGTPTSTEINWIHAKIAENSPASKDGKLVEIILDSIPVNVANFKGGDDRYAYICVVPKDTEITAMFNNGAMKDEYLNMGTSIEQKNYILNYDNILQIMAMDMGTSDPQTSGTSTITANCKYKVEPSSDTQSALEWWTLKVENNVVTISYDLAKVRTLSMGTGATVNFSIIIDRGENLQPILSKKQPPYSIMYNKYF